MVKGVRRKGYIEGFLGGEKELRGNRAGQEPKGVGMGERGSLSYCPRGKVVGTYKLFG